MAREIALLLCRENLPVAAVDSEDIQRLKQNPICRKSTQRVSCYINPVLQIQPQASPIDSRLHLPKDPFQSIDRLTWCIHTHCWEAPGKAAVVLMLYSGKVTLDKSIR